MVETLPIGRRLAFDPSQGRLWVICRHCAKWNLVPFDTRLESIDTCERLFAETRMQFSTDNIGIARLREGLDLVRIGAALRPEFAAWRYGDSFGRRRRRQMVMAAGGVAIVGGLAMGGPIVGLSMGGVAQMLNYGHIYFAYRSITIRVPRREGSPLELTPMLTGQARIVGHDTDGWAIQTKLMEAKAFGGKYKVPSKQEHLIHGPDAVVLLGKLLAKVNQYTGSAKQVRTAVDAVETYPALDHLITSHRIAPKVNAKSRPLRKLPAALRLATEMLVNEESEREALAGELKLLKWQWQEAERLARIDDTLAMPEGIDDQLDRLPRSG